jgi:fatty acid desaturase
VNAIPTPSLKALVAQALAVAVGLNGVLWWDPWLLLALAIGYVVALGTL